MLLAHPLAGFGVAGGVLFLAPVLGGHAVAALVRVGALALVRSREHPERARLTLLKLVAERDGAATGLHLAKPFALLCNWAELDVLTLLTAGCNTPICVIV